MYALDLPLAPTLPTLGISLAATSPGLIQAIASPMHFISTGYGAAVAAMSIWTLAFKGQEERFPLAASLHNIAMTLYGIRLATFLFFRSNTSSYQDREEFKSVKSKWVKMSLKTRLMMWLPCSALYVMMAAPALANMQSGKDIKVSDPIFAVGFTVMAVGLVLEAVADQHKTSLKKKDPGAFASTGVFRICQHPAYLGEVLFWVGNYISGLPSIGLDWRYQLLSAAGLLGILSIMTGASKRLSQKQLEKYGKRADWKKYTSEVKGALFPKL